MSEKEQLVRAGNRGIGACTIISKNYLPYARVLVDSFRQFHTNIPFFVLLVDKVDGYFEPDQEKFTLVRMGDLAIPDLNRFCFQYTPIELNTAAKPYLLTHLFRNYRLAKLIYFDPDILILRNLKRLFCLLDEYSIVLTPHLTAPLPRDGLTPDEVTILRAGTYNLGFVALANTPTTREFLPWWQDRLYDGCRMELDRGMHVDQKWVDLIPGFFKDVYILKEPGYNVAYWNLPTRKVKVKHGAVSVNDQPGYFFHFSGINPDKPQLISKHTNRLELGNVGPAATLYQKYMGLLISRGYHGTKLWPYAYGSFDNGLKIPDAARRLYIQMGDDVRQFGNPFDTTLAKSYLGWLTGSVDNHSDPTRAITRLWYAVYSERPDIQRAFPDIFGEDRDKFLEWAIRNGRFENDIADRFIVHAILPHADVRGSNQRKKGVVRGRFGVNVAGHLNSEKGVGEAVRSVVRTLDAADIHYVLNNYKDPGSANNDTTLSNAHHGNPYRVNLSVLGVDVLPNFLQEKGRGYFSNRYNIGEWLWELTDFPSEWFRNFQSFDEIWVASSFVQGALSKIAPVPVITMPHALSGDIPAQTWRRLHFGLPRGSFVFLFIFDFHSQLTRKNPLGLVKAFEKAFDPKDDALLLLKCAHSQDAPADLAALQEASRGANIRLSDCILSRGQVNALIYSSDCYISLHRAEGFGLTMAEAMSLGKPVIATGYSGNMDFMSVKNSFPVRYKVIPIERDYGPYKRGFVWADPDLDHAAELMRFVYDNREAAAEVGREARKDVFAKLSPEVVASRMKERLLEVAYSR